MVGAKFAALSGLLLLADTVAAKKVVSIPFQKREKITNDYEARSIVKRATYFTAPLNNYLPLAEYFATVQVGTPAQTLELVIDTGSSDVWFFGTGACNEQSAGGECEGGSFNSKDSSTYKLIKANNFSIQYETADSGVFGDYISDTLSIGGISVTNLTMALATSANETQTGILGIGLDTDESAVEYSGKTYQNLPDVLVSEGKIGSKSYSLYLDNLASSSGTVIFGGYDTAKFTGDIVMLPLQVDEYTGVKDTFAVAWTSISFTNTSGTFTLTGTNDFPAAAILDSGTTLTYVPENIFDTLATEVPVEVAYDQESAAYLVECTLRNSAATVDFGFGGTGGTVISVPYSELAVPSYDENGKEQTLTDGTAACIFGIQPNSDESPILFGQTFLRSAYVMYDLDNLAAGLAPTIFDATGSNIVEYMSSGTQASITTDTTGPTVSVASAADNPFGDPFATSSSAIAIGTSAGLGDDGVSLSSTKVLYTRSTPTNIVPASTLAASLTPIGAAANNVASGTTTGAAAAATSGTTTGTAAAASTTAASTTAASTTTKAASAAVAAKSNIAVVLMGTMIVSLLGGCLLL